MISDSEWAREREWLRKKARDARSLARSEEEQLDYILAKRLKERIERRAAQLWWQLFGANGHRLDTIEHEESFIAHLSKVFTYPTAGQFISPADSLRRLYTTPQYSRRGRLQQVEFVAPSVPRLLELMLFGYFQFEDTWIFLDRRGKKHSDGTRRPKQWLALPRNTIPSDRLGIAIEIDLFGGSIYSDNPGNLFSSLKASEKEHLAREYGSVGTHEDWLAAIVENIFFDKGYRSRIWISFAGEVNDKHQTLAELLANDGPVLGKKVVMQDGNYLNCALENLVTCSSRGRRMACSACFQLTTADQSQLLKDATGSSFRVCLSCMRWRLKNLR